MTYYILPKINDTIIIEPTINVDNKYIIPYISHSLIYHLNKIIISNNLLEDYKSVSSIVNPYEFIHTKIPLIEKSISLLNPLYNIFYEFIEIYYLLNLSNCLNNKSIQSLHISSNYNTTIDCLNRVRNNPEDKHFFLNNNTNNIIKYDNIYDFIYCEFDEFNYDNINNYIFKSVNILLQILLFQKNNGLCIIKIENIFYKPIIDIIYILTTLYDKCYIIKPNVSNWCKSEKFIVCKKFNFNLDNQKSYYNHILKILNNKKPILSLIKNNISFYFLNKIEEINIINGQQQLEILNKINNIIKSNNKEDKLKLLKKNNIQKCISWCEKYKIPYFTPYNSYENKIKENKNIFMLYNKYNSF